jgi:hypothetical protein
MGPTVISDNYEKRIQDLEETAASRQKQAEELLTFGQDIDNIYHACPGCGSLRGFNHRPACDWRAFMDSLRKHCV